MPVINSTECAKTADELSRDMPVGPHVLSAADTERLANVGRFNQSLLPRILGAYPTLGNALTHVMRLAAGCAIRPLISTKPSESKLKIMRAMIQLYSLCSAYGLSRMMGYFSNHKVTHLGGLACKHYALEPGATKSSGLAQGCDARKTSEMPLVILAFPGFGGICNTANSWDAPLMNLQQATGAHILAFQYPNMNEEIRGEDQVSAIHRALESLGRHPLFKGHVDAQGHPMGFRFASLSNSYGGLMLASALQSFPAGEAPVQFESSVFQWPFMRIDRSGQSNDAKQNPNSIIPSGPALEAFSAHVRGERRPGDVLLNPLSGDMTNFAQHNLVEIGTEDPVAPDGRAFAEQLVVNQKAADLIVHDPGFHGGEMTTNWLPWGDAAMARAAGFINSHQVGAPAAKTGMSPSVPIVKKLQ